MSTYTQEQLQAMTKEEFFALPEETRIGIKIEQMLLNNGITL